MSFTRKHYEAAARIIREVRPSTHGAVGERENEAFQAGWGACLGNVQFELSKLFASDNPRFDAERFARACEPKGGK